MMDDSGSGSGMDESNSPRSTSENQTVNVRTASIDLAPVHVRALVSEAGGLIPTDHPNIYCTPLPHHCRVNSPIHVPFLIVSTKGIPDGTVVRLSAGNKFNPIAEMKNCEALMSDNVAKFPDLRFVGRSGRGKCLWYHYNSLGYCVCTCYTCTRILCCQYARSDTAYRITIEYGITVVRIPPDSFRQICFIL